MMKHRQYSQQWILGLVLLVFIHSHGVRFMAFFLDMHRFPNIIHHVGT